MRRRRHGRKKPISTFKAGVIGIAVVVIVTYLGFTKFANPFASPFTVHAIVPSANGLRPGNLVRIAGVNVGKVESVSSVPGGAAANVAFTVDDAGLPLHQDATFAIRPRIFLEGNFFVDVNPGSPSSPVAGDGYTFPVQSAVAPVQFDQLLTTLQGDTRRNLQILLKEFGGALEKGGPAYNGSIRYWVPAYQYSSIVNHDLLGLHPHDLSTYISQMATVSGALDQRPFTLQSLVTDLNRTADAFAVQSGNLQRAVGDLPVTLGAATPAFNHLNAALPPLRTFAKALDPGVRSSGPAIDASLPFITQLRLLVRPSELRGLTADLSVAVPALAQLVQRSIPLYKNGVRPFASCISNNVIPWSHATVPDRNFTAANGFPPREAYIEGVDFLPGLAGESRDFDANGPYIRILAGGGTLTYSLQPGLFGTALAPLTAVQPVPPPGGSRPPLNENTVCETQAPTTNLSAEQGLPIKSIDTSKGQIPGALGLNRDSQEAMIQAMRRVIRQQHLPYRVADLPPLKANKS